MSLGPAIATTLLAVACISAAWVLRRAGAGIVACCATAAVGGFLLTDLVLRPGGWDDQRWLIAAGLLAAPIAVTAYPRVAAGGSRAESAVVLALVAVVGTVAVAWPSAASYLMLLTGLVVIWHVWWVAERGSDGDRSAMLWTAAVGGFVGMSALLFSFSFEALARSTGGDAPVVFSAVLVTFLPIAMAVGLVNPEVVDVRWLVTTLVVTLTVVVCFIAAASTVVFGLEWLGGAPLDSSSVLAVCAFLALAVSPVRGWLYGTIEVMLFGGRPDPITALASVASRMGDDLAGSLETVRTALVLPFVRLEADGAEPAAAGVETPHVTVIELDLGPGRRGRLVVGRRPGERTWSPADLGVLGLVAPLLGRTVRAQLLADQLAASRSQAVAAIEDERRRLRRDLHDGLGPTLSGVAFTADAARNLVERDPGAAADLLVRLRSDTANAIVEVRRLVEGLRPPALDELGLVGALRTWATGLYAAGGTQLTVRFAGEDHVDGLTAAGEVAAYRIAVEALTNVARHSGSPDATVSFSALAGAWRVEVTDRGVGGDWVPGTGLSSMRERAEAVGGRLEVGGGRVAVTVPSSGPALV